MKANPSRTGAGPNRSATNPNSPPARRASPISGVAGAEIVLGHVGQVQFPARAHALIGDLRGKDRRRRLDRSPIGVQRQLIARHGVFFQRVGE